MNVKDVLRYGQYTVLGAVENVPETSLQLSGACGYWSVKDIVAHLASYELVLVDVLSSLAGSDVTPNLDRFVELGEGFNDAEVENRRSRGMHDVLTELTSAHDEALRLVSGVAPERMREPGTLPWYGDDYSLDDLVVYQYYGHKREHAAQIADFADQPIPQEAASPNWGDE